MIQINGIGFCSGSGSRMAELTDAVGIARRAGIQIQDALRKQLRRRGAFIAAGVLAAMEALQDSGIAPEELAQAGIIVTSQLGDQNTTSEFIDDLLDYGTDQGSPIKFAHSSHNAAASYIATQFNIYGPAITSVNFTACFDNGMTLAQGWLEQGVCEHVLLLQIESDSPLSRVLRHYRTGHLEQTSAEPEKTVQADSKAPCEAACLLFGKHGLKPDRQIRFSWSSPVIGENVTAETAIADTLLAEPVRLLTAILRPQNRQAVILGGKCGLVEKH